ncbi:UNVERIFIED_CONTAM: hypothetical protein HDU68_007720 [Siphonaria sp. JEL0065]|nr:hypothetical protein HDU68_007720 [Siphonaria sp. JEL0065]
MTSNPPPKKTFAQAATPATTASSSASSTAKSTPPTVPPKDGDNKKSNNNVLTGPATAQEISIATILGACSGYTCKKLAKGSALLIGIAFMSLQALAYTGLITINWEKLESALVKRIDADGDGKLTFKDFQLLGYRFVHNLGKSLPSGAGFTAAFFLGFRYG